MTMTLNISDDLKPDEAAELVEIAREQQKPLGVLLLEAARDAVRRRQASREPRTENREPAAA
jgi:hypothetical protein